MESAGACCSTRSTRWCSLGLRPPRRWLSGVDTIALHWLGVCKGFAPLTWGLGAAEVVLRCPYQFPSPLFSFPSYPSVASGPGFRGKGEQTRQSELIGGEGDDRGRVQSKILQSFLSNPLSHQEPPSSQFLVLPPE